MKRKIMILVLTLMIGLTGFVIWQDISNSPFLINKGKSDLVQEPVKIAIIDNGFDLNAVNYDKKINITKYNSIENNEDISINNKRGSLVFSALYNDKNSLNLKNDVILIKAFTNVGDINNDNIVKALDFACENNAKIISLGFNLVEDENVSASIKKCQEKGAAIVAAANTKPDGQVEYPANLDNVISVSQLTSQTLSDVKVDAKLQQVCLSNNCQFNKHIALSTVNAAGYLAVYKDPVKESKDLNLKMQYGISRIQEK